MTLYSEVVNFTRLHQHYHNYSNFYPSYYSSQVNLQNPSLTDSDGDDSGLYGIYTYNKGVF